MNHKYCVSWSEIQAEKRRNGTWRAWSYFLAVSLGLALGLFVIGIANTFAT